MGVTTQADLIALVVRQIAEFFRQRGLYLATERDPATWRDIYKELGGGGLPFELNQSAAGFASADGLGVTLAAGNGAELIGIQFA